MMTRMPVATPAAPNAGRPELNAHAAKPNDSAVSSVTKMRWKTFSDISMGRARRKIVHRVERQREQADNEKHGETEHGVNHPLFRNQVHEKAGHDEGVRGGYTE